MMRGSSRYFSREALTAYLFALPALGLQILFSSSISTSQVGLVVPLPELSGIVGTALRILPWVIVVISAYAVATFRPSILVALLAASFFISAILTSTVDIFQASAATVATFLALIGFNYSRAAKVLSGRELILESRGPASFRVVSLALELGLPLVAALAALQLVGIMIEFVRTQVVTLPQPISTLAGLYLQSRVGLVLTTIVVAGASIWAIDTLIAPLVLYYTLTGEEALGLARSEFEDISKKVRRQSMWNAKPGSGPILLMLLAASFGAVLAFLLSGSATIIGNDFLSVFGLGHVSWTTTESNVIGLAMNYTRQANTIVSNAQDFIRELIHLLWG